MSNTISALTSAGVQYTGYSYDTAGKNTADAKETAAADSGVVYEKSDSNGADKKATYTINKMSEEDRAALVKQLKEDQANRESQLTSLVSKMLTGQAETYGTATGMWELFASGKLTVTPEIQKQAQEDIAEDGYWGVKQTSQRLFDFASALAGDDEAMMNKMQESMLKGFKQATGAWGRELPEICSDTLDAANKLFEDYYAAKKDEK